MHRVLDLHMLPFNSPHYPSSDPSVDNGIALPCLSTPAVYQMCRPEESCTPDAWSDYARRASGAALTRDSSHIHIENDPTLFAPIPVAGQLSVLFSGPLNYDYPDYQTSQQSVQDVNYPQGFDDRAAPAASPSNVDCSQYAVCNAPNVYDKDGVPAQTFPTPSELLVELAGHRPADPQHCDSNRNIHGLARRSRRRPLNRSIGFIQSDSRENITSHEKKRHYLECLEHYVLYLRQQLQLVGAEPGPLERVQQYRGLNNRSIRTLLVHMENTTRKFGVRIEREEQRFMSLRDAVYSQDVAVAQALQDLKVPNGQDM
ncbi:hypothetical protein APHAL10511_006329 [Amanita phalloides]|nr:hypothetical protein APHAL10511_006329 [Amanita phalloides]